jgi:hypothetical protein
MKEKENLQREPTKRTYKENLRFPFDPSLLFFFKFLQLKTVILNKREGSKGISHRLRLIRRFSL